MAKKKILFLFAPKFREFGVDVARELISIYSDTALGGLCTGGQSVVTYVKDNIKDELLFAHSLEHQEKQWLALSNEQIDYKYLSEIDKKYGHGTVGEVITADRRVGLGFVRGGLTRPDEVGDAVMSNPIEATQTYIQGLFQFIEKLFDEHKFVGVFCYAVAGGPAVALAKVCSAKGIPFTKFNVTRIGDGFIVDTDYKGRLFPIAERFNSNEILNKELTERATIFLKNYRDKPVNPSYMNYNNTKVKENRVFPLLINLFLSTVALVLKPFLSGKHINLLGLKRTLFELKLEWRKVRFDFSVFESTTPIYKYLYYPLHVDPEASTMVMSPMHTDQISVIESISKSLPGDKVLVVKEHLPMVGKRSKLFYEQIKKIPRVKLVSPYLKSHDLIRTSDGVVVITGTAAFEAVLLERKAIVIGDSPYLAMNTGMIHEPCLCNLPEAVSKLEELEPIDDKKIIRYIACALDESFDMGVEVLWGNYSCIGSDERQAISRCISLKIDGFINEIL